MKSKTKATKSSVSSDGPGMTADSSHRASIFFMHLNRAGGIPWVRLCGACLAHGIAPRFCVRTDAYPYGNVAVYVASGSWRRKALTVSAEKMPGVSAIDTTNFARQIVLDFEFAPVPKQRQRRGLRNEIIEVGAVKLDYHGNVMGEFSQFVQTEALRSPSASSQGYRPWAPRWPIRSTW